MMATIGRLEKESWDKYGKIFIETRRSIASAKRKDIEKRNLAMKWVNQRNSYI